MIDAPHAVVVRIRDEQTAIRSPVPATMRIVPSADIARTGTTKSGDRSAVSVGGPAPAGLPASHGPFGVRFTPARQSTKLQVVSEKRYMGLTYIDGIVAGPRGQRVVTFLVDTGAQYSLLPNEVWKALGLEAMRSRAFHLADGTRIERAVSECIIELPEVGGEIPRGHTPVILGEAGDVALLGVVTLENLGLVFNPFDRSLRPMREAPLTRIAAGAIGEPDGTLSEPLRSSSPVASELSIGVR